MKIYRLTYHEREKNFSHVTGYFSSFEKALYYWDIKLKPALLLVTGQAEGDIFELSVDEHIADKYIWSSSE